MNIELVAFPNQVDRTCLVDEIIWGHRFRDDQKAWPMVLEMLNLADACLREPTSDGKVLVDIQEMQSLRKPFNPKPHFRMHFRFLLFGLNQKAAELAERFKAHDITSDEAWAEWLKEANQTHTVPGTVDYSDLQERFDDFGQFERAVDLLRSTALDLGTEKRSVWTRFLFPIASEALYWEGQVKNNPITGEKSVDQTVNFFTRAGSLLFLMLCRAQNANRLSELLRGFLERESDGRTLVKLLQVEDLNDGDRQAPHVFLPFAKHPRFDNLGQDLERILELPAPENERMAFFVPLAALHTSLYHLEVAAGRILGKALPIPMVCEIIAPRKTIVREESVNSYSRNSDCARMALEKFLKDAFEKPEWQEIILDTATSRIDRAIRARNFILATLRPPEDELTQPDHVQDVDDLRKEAVQFFQQRHNREISKVHSEYGKQAGLACKRGTNRYRYAPTDTLLQSIVLANVKTEMPFEEFLDILLSKYGMVIGPRNKPAIEAGGHKELANKIGATAFKNNQLRLESRLKSMGMLRKLSDSQAYVLNPLSANR